MDSEKADRLPALIIQSSQDAILSRDLDGTVTSWNPAAEKLFGFSHLHMVGKNIDQIIPEKLIAEWRDMDAALKTNGHGASVETVRQRLDGGPVFVSLQLSPIWNADQNLIGVGEIYRDISDRIRAETALAEMTKRNDEYVATMAHELRTPMNAIVGLITLLQSSAILGEKEKKFLTTLKTSADDLTRLMSEFFTRTRSQSHLMAKNTEHIRAIETFKLSDPNGAMTHRNVLLVEDYPPTIVMVEAMLDQLGYDHDVARNGLDALNKLMTGSYDVVLMDVEMAELDGLEATRKLRSLEKEQKLSYTPVIAVTAMIREEDQHACTAAGMDDFIPKPFHPSDLATKLARHIPTQERKTAT